ncbi:hypothetical protein CPC08DRAFT_720594 [Agrocybe pediades]|nr:hypothetical protein CPC08DRAFT_720594 [Agrocybe pediades]
MGVSIWLALRLYRKRVAARREAKMGAAFLSVKGLVPEGALNEKVDSEYAQRPVTEVKGFSRNKIDSTVVLPARARVIRENVSDEEINIRVESEPFPETPSTAKPFLFSLNTALNDKKLGGPDVSPMSGMSPSQTRNSWVSWASPAASQHRFSVMSSTSSFDASTTSGTSRKVRQLFEPVLPDELLTSLGEHLTVVQSFDDGWCVVGRENSSFVQTAKSLFKSTPAPETNVELGVVPAWCFLKPVKGLRAERPVRSTSLGVTVNLEAQTGSRHDAVSWSNF